MDGYSGWVAVDGGVRVAKQGRGRVGGWLYENTICNRPKKIAFRDTLALLTRKKALQWPQNLFAKLNSLKTQYRCSWSGLVRGR